MKTKSIILVASFAFASFISLPAFGQLTGAVGSTLGATGRATGNTGGMRGDLGLNQTLNGSAVGGDLGFGVDAISTNDATTDISRRGAHTPDSRPAVGDATARSKAKVKSVSGKAIATGNEVKSTSAARVQSAKGEVAQAVDSTQASTSGQGSAQADAKSSNGSRSASSDVNLSRTVNSSVAGKNISTGADADSNASVKSQRQSDGSSGSKIAASNSNSGNTRLHGLGSAESLVSHKADVNATGNKEKRKASVDASSESETSVKAERQPKK